MKKKLLLALIPLTVLMLFSSGVVYAVDKSDEITFADPAVETAVREALGGISGTIHEDDVEAITFLWIYGNPYLWEGDIIDLSGLENLSKLRQLTMNNVGVTDFSPLSGLNDFESVVFDSSEITDLTQLSSLPNLKSLSFKNCRFYDLSALNLSYLTGLRHLNIIDSRINDISRLYFPDGLCSLSLQNNGINEIPQLSHTTMLASLEIVENRISDITPLSELQMLRSLHLAENQISDITPLATLESLDMLNLSGNHVCNIDALSSLGNLNFLYLQDNDIVDLAPLLEIDYSGDGFKGIMSDGTAVYSDGMELYIKGNPLSERYIEDYIPQLEEKGILIDYHTSY